MNCALVIDITVLPVLVLVLVSNSQPKSSISNKSHIRYGTIQILRSRIYAYDDNLYLLHLHLHLCLAAMPVDNHHSHRLWYYNPSPSLSLCNCHMPVKEDSESDFCESFICKLIHTYGLLLILPIYNYKLQEIFFPLNIYNNICVCVCFCMKI